MTDAEHLDWFNREFWRTLQGPGVGALSRLQRDALCVMNFQGRILVSRGSLCVAAAPATERHVRRVEGRCVWTCLQINGERSVNGWPSKRGWSKRGTFRGCGIGLVAAFVLGFERAQALFGFG